METFKHIPHEDQDDANAFYLAGLEKYDPSSVSGITPEPRSYGNEPAADYPPNTAIDYRPEPYKEEQFQYGSWVYGRQWEGEFETVIEPKTPRSHYQPPVKLSKDTRSKWLKVGDVVAVTFLLGVGMFMGMLYLGFFEVMAQWLKL